MILSDSVLETNENYYSQVFLKEYKSTEKEKVSRYITDDLKSDDEPDEENIKIKHHDEDLILKGKYDACKKFFMLKNIGHLSLKWEGSTWNMYSVFLFIFPVLYNTVNNVILYTIFTIIISVGKRLNLLIVL